MNRTLIITLALAWASSSCASLMARSTALAEDVTATMQSYVEKAETERAAFMEAQAKRQTEFEQRMIELNSETDQKIDAIESTWTGTPVELANEISRLEEGFTLAQKMMLEQLRHENKEAVEVLADRELERAKELLAEGTEAITEFKVGVEEDLDKLKTDGKQLAVDVARAGAGVLGYGPLADMLLYMFGGAGVAAPVVNSYRNSKRKTRGEPV